MSISITVEVLDYHGNPAQGLNVALHIEGLITGDVQEEYTDESGHAYFETTRDYESDRKIRFRVMGNDYGPYEIEDGGAYTIQLD